MTEPKQASEAPFPYRSSVVCFIEQTSDDRLQQLRYLEEKRDALARARALESTIYAVWPGDYRSDLFLIDDLDQLAEAFGV